MAAADRESPWYHYTCEHGASNDPCSICFPKAPKVPADWVAGYKPPTDPVTQVVSDTITKVTKK